MTSARKRSRAPGLAAAVLAFGALPAVLAQGAGEVTTSPPAGDSPSPAPDPEDAPRAEAPEASRVDYEIRANLTPFQRDEGGVALQRFQLDGSETIRWTNRSADRVSDLRFHLYLNAFANNRSVHLRGTGENLRGKDVADMNREGWWGWQRVKRITVDGADVTASMRFLQPDASDATSEDRTVFAVDAGKEIAPGETATIEVEWESLLPRVRRRTGTKGDFLFVAQWFPKLGVYESGRGWNCHSFHAVTEFFSDYGTYRVTLDLPREYSEHVGGSGVRTQNLVRGADRVEVVFEAPSLADRQRPGCFGKLPLVHDFAWTADPDTVVYNDTFRPADWMERFPEQVRLARAAFGEEVDLGLRDVAVTVLIQPEHEGQAQRHFEATCAALFFYGLWFGGYPYEHITVVDPAWGAGAAGGMEYPTLFTAGTRLFTTREMHSPESVTVHECGHQFWYGLVGDNEFEAAWLDEGFNSYTDSEVLKLAYGPSCRTTSYLHLPIAGERPTSVPGGGDWLRTLTGRDWSLAFLKGRGFLDAVGGVRIDPLRQTGLVEWWRDQPLLTLEPAWDDPRWGDRSGYLRDANSDAIDTPAWEYVDRGSYRTNSYPRPAIALRSLAGLIGNEAFLRGMRHYSGEWRYGHPYPADFFASFAEGSGADVQWYFDDAFRSTKTIDWSVEVNQGIEPKEQGWFPGPDGAYFEHGKDEEKEEDEPSTTETASAPHGDVIPPAEASEPKDEPAKAEAKERMRQVEILLRRKGELCLPLKWQVRIGPDPEHAAKAKGAAEGPSEVREFTWTREEQLARAWQRTRFELPRDRRVEAVVLDPERRYYFDRDMSDNQWYAERETVAPLRFAERALVQYQHLLHWFASVGG